MPIRLSGLASGLDTEAIVGALVSSYTYKKEKYTKAQTKLSWKQDEWKSLNTKIYSLYKDVGNLRYSSNYSLQKVSVSDSTKASVTASGSAINGRQTLEITQLAATGYMTGGKLDSSVTGSTTLSELGADFSSTSNKGKFNVTVAGKTTEVEVDGDTTIDDLTNKLSSAGLQVSFDESNKRFFISSNDSGEENDFSINATNVEGLKALSVAGLVTDTYINRISEDKEMIQTLRDLNGDTSTEYDASKTKSQVQGAVFSIHNAFVTLASSKSTEEEIAAAKETITKYGGTFNEDGEYESATEGSFIAYVENSIGSNYDWVQSDATETADAIFNRLDAAQAIDDGTIDISKDARATKIDGADTKILLNGVEYSSASSSITVNGLSIEALAKTEEDSPITINTTTDVSGIYDKIKDFLTSYNNLINEMQKLYNADSAKDYEPLTDDEKAEMSETEIEKWEQKIKDSLLRRDSTLSSIISSMTTAMMKTYDINGETVSWSTFAVHTLGTMNAEKNENYAYHIDGDSEDSYTSGNVDKLLKALNEDPDKVIEFMKDVTSGLYSELDKKMKSTSVKSVYTVYNDKEMASEYSNYSKLIKTWTERVNDMEESYYKKFSAMEKALATLQGNSSSISSLLGG